VHAHANFEWLEVVGRSNHLGSCVCAECQKVLCFLLYSIVYEFSHPTHLEGLKIIGRSKCLGCVCVGCRKVLCFLLYGIVSHPTHWAVLMTITAYACRCEGCEYTNTILLRNAVDYTRLCALQRVPYTHLRAWQRPYQPLQSHACWERASSKSQLCNNLL